MTFRRASAWFLLHLEFIHGYHVPIGFDVLRRRYFYYAQVLHKKNIQSELIVFQNPKDMSEKDQIDGSKAEKYDIEPPIYRSKKIQNLIKRNENFEAPSSRRRMAHKKKQPKYDFVDDIPFTNNEISSSNDAVSLINTNSNNSWDYSDSDYAIDSFLRGEYDKPFAEDAPAPTPDYTPGQTVEIALESLRRLNEPDQSHGAAVFMRFLSPLTRNDRWGGSNTVLSPWKQILRGALTPTMLAKRIRFSGEFSPLLDWTRLDTTEGMAVSDSSQSRLGMGPSVAFVNAALYLGPGISPTIIQVTLRKISGVWLIENLSSCRETLFTTRDESLS